MFFWAVNSIFILFAIFNIDDPDWFLWIPTYLLVVAITAAYRNKKVSKKAVNILLLYLLLLFVISFFGLIESLDNSSDIMAKMKEPKREALGALISMVWVFWISRQ
jgi:hypothetical protein|tara:strand:+ start:23084 stop:23401 length:318 start_codon:yes stop_codon:yes gene_type:complete